MATRKRRSDSATTAAGVHVKDVTIQRAFKGDFPCPDEDQFLLVRRDTDRSGPETAWGVDILDDQVDVPIQDARRHLDELVAEEIKSHVRFHGGAGLSWTRQARGFIDAARKLGDLEGYLRGTLEARAKLDGLHFHLALADHMEAEGGKATKKRARKKAVA